MQRPWLRRLQEWTDAPGFRQQTVDAAAAQLRLLLPAYPLPSDAPAAICADGLRWYVTKMEAMADAVRRSGLSPHSPGATLEGVEWHLVENEQAMWAVPGRCALPRQTVPPVAGERLAKAIVRSSDCWPVRRYLGL